MSTKQGFVKDFSGNKMVPQTTSAQVIDLAKEQALSQTLLDTPLKNVLGIADFDTVTPKVAGAVVYYNNKLWEFTSPHAAGAFDPSEVEETNLIEIITKRLASGEITPAQAETLASWKGDTMGAEYVQSGTVETTGGNISIDSSVAAKLMKIDPVSDFYAENLVATGFNLLRRAVQVDTAWYFMVPHLVATNASIGTAQENNGVLFTGSNGANLTPSVRFKPLADGVPTTMTDGNETTYTDKDGRRHYTTSGAGYLIVSGIDRATVCAHIGWSKRYDDYVAVDDANDAGSVVGLSSIINALHSYGKMLIVGNVMDSIERKDGSTVTWHRRLDRVMPTWTTTPVEEGGVATGQYLHEATISNMKNGGVAAFMTDAIGLAVDGQKVSYTDSNSGASSDYVKYELDAEVHGDVSIDTSFGVEDWGLVMLTNEVGLANVTILYAQGIPDNVRTSLPQINSLRQTAAAVSLGYGICATDTYNPSRVVTIKDFMLLENGTINVLFTTPVNAANATLNVSLTGAKPIRIMGSSLPAGFIKAQTYATLAYDGDAWNIVGIYEPSVTPDGLVVDMGLTSGVKWASRDIDLTKPGGFCETPFTYEKSFFSWGNIDGHNPINTVAFDYNWGSVNGAEPWYEGQPYGNTPGCTLTGNISDSFDAARVNLGSPWRMPTTGEYAELFANIRYIDANGDEITGTNKLTTVNGITGLYLESTINGNRLFFACSGYGGGTTWILRGSYGLYWSASFYSSRYAYCLNFYSGGVGPQDYNYRFDGFAVRPVQ